MTMRLRVGVWVFGCAAALGAGAGAGMVAGAQEAKTAAVVHPVFPGNETGLGQTIAALVAEPAVARAHWGVAVTALDGTPIYGLNEGQMFRPASNAKLYTSVAATAMLGLERRFTTTVVGRGEVRGGVLRGEIVLRGGGDANFAGGYALPYVAPAERAKGYVADGPGLRDFDELAAQVAAKGIREVDGDVVGDDTRFEDVRYPAGWSIEDMLWGYGAPVSALAVHDNQLELKITPAAGKQARDAISLSPEVPFYTVDATAVNGQKAGVMNDDSAGRNDVEEWREPGERDFEIRGEVAAKFGAYTDELAIDRPAEFAAAALKQALEKRGIVVTGGVRAKHWGDGAGDELLKRAHALPAVVSMDQSAQKTGANRGDVFSPHADCEEEGTRVGAAAGGVDAGGEDIRGFRDRSEVDAEGVAEFACGDHAPQRWRGSWLRPFPWRCAGVGAGLPYAAGGAGWGGLRVL